MLVMEKGSYVNCSPPSMNDFPADVFSQSQRAAGALCLHVLGACYACFGIAVVCDSYFVPSVQRLGQRLKLSPDVTGATLMAAATSSPEFFASLIGSFITKSDIGTGTIIGSAVFNILAVPSLCGLFTGQAVELTWWPLSRDCVCYLLSVIALVVIIVDGKIFWYEAAVLIFIFILYVFIMMYNDKLEKCIGSRFKRRSGSNDDEVESLVIQDVSHESQTGTDEDVEIEEEKEGEKGTQDSFSPISFPSGNWFQKLIYCLKYPMLLVLFLTVPDCESNKWKHMYPVTFIMSVLYIGAFSYFLTWMITIAGYTLGLPDVIMGVTFLAFATSVPEGFSSIIVCRKGFGDMALSNSLGSNVFDILVCLGIPWFVKAALASTWDSPFGYVTIRSGGLLYTGSALMATVTVLLLTVICSKFRLNFKVGFILGLFYLTFIAFSISVEMLFRTHCRSHL